MHGLRSEIFLTVRPDELSTVVHLTFPARCVFGVGENIDSGGGTCQTIYGPAIDDPKTWAQENHACRRTCWMYSGRR